MPPKKNAPPPKNKGPTTKTLNKEKAKVVDDKTFGLKNKNKSKVVQAHIKTVTVQVMDGGTKKVSIKIRNLICNNLTRFALSFFRVANAPKRRQKPKKRQTNRNQPLRRRFWPLFSRESPRS